MSAYVWKIDGIYSVDAQTAGKELERIYQETGRLEPKDIVEASRPKKAPLHNCFEWDDEKAAAKYREHQAQKIIQAVAYVQDINEPEPIRAFVSVQNEYKPISVVLASVDMSSELLANALRELRTFELKYRQLQELMPVFEAIKEVAA